jgi:hypothetical protein
MPDQPSNSQSPHTFGNPHQGMPTAPEADGENSPRRESANAGPDDVGFARVLGWARRGLDQLEQAAEQRSPSRVLSYREVVGYLAENQPTGESLVRGALMRQRNLLAWTFRLMYLDQDDQPLTDPRTGRTRGSIVVARDCDDELRELFGNADLIIFS